MSAEVGVSTGLKSAGLLAMPVMSVAGSSWSCGPGDMISWKISSKISSSLRAWLAPPHSDGCMLGAWAYCAAAACAGCWYCVCVLSAWKSMNAYSASSLLDRQSAGVMACDIVCTALRLL